MSYRVICLAVVLSTVGPVAHAGPGSGQPERSRAEAALARLGPGLSVRWTAAARPVVIRGLDVSVRGADDADRARRFVLQHPDLFLGRAGGSRLELVDLRGTRDRRVVRLRQLHRGLEVVGARVAVSLDSRGHVRAVRSSVGPLSLPTATARIDGRAAVSAARRTLGLGEGRGRAELVVWSEGRARLAYRVALAGDPSFRVYFVDAGDGSYLGARRGAIIEGVRR